MNELPPLVWHCEKRKVKELAPFEHNPRVLTAKQAEFLTASVKKFNLVEIPAINTNNMICAGHQRVKILALLGRADEEIDVRVPNRALTDEEFTEYLVRSNKNTGDWDWDVLANVFSVDNLIDWGFTEAELGINSTFSPDEKDDDVPDEVTIKVNSSVGDIYEIITPESKIRIACGDCRNKSIMASLTSGALSDMVITDPPYGVDNDGGNKKEHLGERKIQNDDMSVEDFKKFMESFISSIHGNIKNGAHAYLFMSDRHFGRMMQLMEEAGFHFSSTIVWVKSSMVIGRGDYQSRMELAWYGWKEGAARLHPFEDRTITNVWEADRPVKSDLHPTTKPCILMENAIKHASNKGDTVLDTFLGSGTTAIACLKHGRNLFATEIDPKYVDTSLYRIKKWCDDSGVDYSVKKNDVPYSVPDIFKPDDEIPDGIDQN
jgi:DNA modification methylase